MLIPIVILFSSIFVPVSCLELIGNRALPCGGVSPCYCHDLENSDERAIPRRLSMKIEPATRFELALDEVFFVEESNVQLVGAHLFFIDFKEELVGAVSSIRELQLLEFGEYNFIPAKEQILKREGVWPGGSFSSRESLAFQYLDSGVESFSRLHYDVWQAPEQLSVEALDIDLPKVVWIDRSHNSNNLTHIFFKDQALDTVTLVPQTTQYLLMYMFNTNTRLEAMRFKPSVANNYVVFSEYYPSENISVGLLYNIKTEGLMSFGSEPGTNSILHCRVKPIGKNMTSASLFYIEKSVGGVVELDEIRFNKTQGQFLFSSGLALNTVSLNIVFLPEWKHVEVELMNQDQYLWNAFHTTYRLFVQVCNTKSFDPSTTVCMIQSCDVGESCDSFTTFFTSKPGERVRLHTASGKSLLYFVNENMFYRLDQREAPYSLFQSTCQLIPSNTLKAASVFYDIVTLILGNGEILLFDMDKDNDFVLDVEDRFPLDGSEFIDSDNDGVGDEHDVLDFSGFSCASESGEGAQCVSDNVVLYVLFTFFVIVTCFSVMKLSDRYHGIFNAYITAIEKEVLKRQWGGPEAMSKSAAISSHYRTKSSNGGGYSGGNKYRKKRASLIVQNGGGNIRDALMEYFDTHEFQSIKELANKMLSHADEYDERLPVFHKKCDKLVQKIMGQRHPTLSIFAQQMQYSLDFLAVLSFLLGYLPMTYAFVYGETTAISYGAKIQIQWIDWYISSIFLLCLIEDLRWVEGSVSNFLFAHWYDIVALVTLPPGVYEYMSGYYAVAQILRCFVVFRVYRIYRRVFLEEKLVHFMIMQPDYFIFTFMVIFVVICSAMIAQVEIAVNPDTLGHMAKSLWFSAFTVTTVGYGDYTPSTEIGRVIAISMMLLGVGLVGTISGSVARAIQTVGSTEEKVKQLKADNRARYEQFKEVLDICALAYNPVLGILPAIIVGEDTEKKMQEINNSKLEQLHQAKSGFGANILLGGGVDSNDVDTAYSPSHKRASTVSVSPYMNQASKPASLVGNAVFPLCLPLAEVIGTNYEWTRESTLGRAAARLAPRRKQIAKDKFHAYLDSKRGLCPPRARIMLLLESFQLDTYSRITNFDEFVNKIARVILEPPKQHQIVLERAMAMQTDSATIPTKLKPKKHSHKSLDADLKGTTPNQGEDEDPFDFGKYSLVDPIDEKLERMEQILTHPQYKLLRRVDFGLLITELTLIALEYDRLLTARWAYQNLQPKSQTSSIRVKCLSRNSFTHIKNLLQTLPEGKKQVMPTEFVEKLATVDDSDDLQIPLVLPTPTGKNKFANLIRGAMKKKRFTEMKFSSKLLMKQEPKDEAEKEGEEVGALPEKPPITRMDSDGNRNSNHHSSAQSAASNKSVTKTEGGATSFFTMARRRFSILKPSSLSGERRASIEISDMLTQIQPEPVELEQKELEM